MINIQIEIVIKLLNKKYVNTNKKFEICYKVFGIY